MKEKQVKISGPDYPISIQRNPHIRPLNTFQARTLTFPSWNGRITLPTVLTKAIAIITAFPLAERSRSTLCGRTRIPFLLLSRLGGMLRSTPSG